MEAHKHRTVHDYHGIKHTQTRGNFLAKKKKCPYTFIIIAKDDSSIYVGVNLSW